VVLREELIGSSDVATCDRFKEKEEKKETR